MQPLRRFLIPASLLMGLATQAHDLVVPGIGQRAIVLDGHLDSAEWAGAAVRALDDGMTVRLQHDGRHLYIAVTGSRFGFNSLCTVRGDAVRILHASAALGAVTYTRRGDEWTSGDTAFTYGMRNTDTTAAARAERAAYLAANGWVANTVRMGAGLAQEFQVSLDQLADPPRLALGRFVPVAGTAEIARWPATVDATDGCVAPRLVSGYVPTPLRFDPTRWLTLRLQR
ncbi:MAG: hypothetical protein H7066_21150 [Cytophagaceae bacterium]|nr:hypothetical protein [Gemmatimonadaceae bacterium]